MNLSRKLSCFGIGVVMFGLSLSMLGLLGSFDLIGDERWRTDAGINLLLLTLAVSAAAPPLLIKYRKMRNVKGFLVLAALISSVVLLLSWRLEASTLIQWGRMDGGDALLTMLVLAFFITGSLCWFRLPFPQRAERTAPKSELREHELPSAEYLHRRRK